MSTEATENRPRHSATVTRRQLEDIRACLIAEMRHGEYPLAYYAAAITEVQSALSDWLDSYPDAVKSRRSLEPGSDDFLRVAAGEMQATR